MLNIYKLISTIPAIPFKYVQALQSDIQSRSDSVVELIKSTEEFLSESGPRLSPEDRAAMERKLSAARGQYATLRESSQAMQRELDSALSTALQQQSQKVGLERRAMHFN
ncbi:UNVERIFIED_CONTAM: hypothetical protein FKN15_042588 [Acipenser sinensis]